MFWLLVPIILSLLSQEESGLFSWVKWFLFYFFCERLCHLISYSRWYTLMFFILFFYDDRYHKSQAIYLESKDNTKISCVISSVGTNEVSFSSNLYPYILPVCSRVGSWGQQQTFFSQTTSVCSSERTPKFSCGFLPVSVHKLETFFFSIHLYELLYFLSPWCINLVLPVESLTLWWSNLGLWTLCSVSLFI